MMKNYSKSSGVVSVLTVLLLICPGYLSAQQVDLQDYFPHNVGDLWQYEELNTSHSTVPGFSSRKIFEIRVTRVDTLEDGSRYVYVNNNHKPRWYIDSLYVYQMPSKLKIFTFAPDELHSWWVTPHSDTTDFLRNYWRHVAQPENGEVFGLPNQVVKVSEWGHTARGDTSNVFRKDRTESYALGIGLINAQVDYVAQDWQLKGAVLQSDTLGTIIEIAETDIFDWFPVQLGNRWQYRDVDSGELTDLRITQVDTLHNGNLEVYINNQFSYLVKPNDATVYFSWGGHRENMDLYLQMNAGMRGPWWQNDYDDQSQGGTWIQMIHSYVGYIFGRHFDMRVYNYFYSSHAGNYRSAIHDFDYGYAKGIGKTYEADYVGIYRYLAGAEIDGQIYGTLVSLDEEETDIPAAFHLAQNYPNPFNPSTTLRYDLDEPGPVRLEVFDLTGRRVALLADGPSPAGRHTVDFNAAGFASGFYIARLTAGGAVQHRKMLLVR